MPPGKRNSSLTRVHPFFERAFALDSTGAGWLSPLLHMAPFGNAAIGQLVDEPGELSSALLQPHPHGKAPRACFEYGVAPPERFLRWCIDHPDELTWPASASFSADTQKWRRALLCDEPPGREQAQTEAHNQLTTHGPSKNGWWRFEGESSIDCVIATDRLVLTIEGKRTDVLSPATDWYPKRTQLVRNLEAANQLANGRRWGTLLMTEEPIADGTPEAVARSLGDAAPHLSEAEKAELQHAYLGNVTWQQACDTIGIDFALLPNEINVG